MKTRQGRTAKAAEASQPYGLNGSQKNGDNGEVAIGTQDYQQQLNQLRQWVAAANHGQTPGAEPSGQTESGGIVESLSFLQTLVEGSPDAIFVKDAQGRYLFINATFAYWTQKSSRELIGKKDGDLFKQEVAGRLADLDQQVLLNGQPLTEEIVLDDLTMEGGAERSLVLTEIPFRNHAQQVIGLICVARDNTLRKLMEEELRESKQFSEQIIDSAREGIVVYDADLRYSLWNSFMEEFTGIPSHKVIGRHPIEIFPTIREQGTLDLIELALKGETLTSPDFLINSLQGSKNAWAVYQFGPLRDLKGEIIGVIATVTDITERKKIEAALRRSQQFNQQVIANASEGILVCDRELRCMVWNPVLEELSGENGEAALGRSILDLLPHWREEGLTEMLVQALQGDMVESPDFKLDRSRQIWVSAKYSPLRDADEEIIGVIGVLTDTTARRKAEEALRESQQFNIQVIDNALEGIAVYDRELRVVVWNPFMEELLDTHKAHVLGAHVLEVFPHLRGSESQECWERALAGETIQGRELQLNDSKEKWVSASYGPLRNPRGELVGVIVTMRDITARKEAEEALHASQRFNQQVIENAREGIIVCDNELNYLVWNPAMENFSGIRASAVLGKNSLEVFPELTGSDLHKRLQQALTGATLMRYDYKAKFEASGKEGYFSRQDSPLRDEHGKIVGLISIISDITERQQTLDALRQSEERYRQILATIQDGYFEVSLRGELEFFNDSLCLICGCKRKDLNGTGYRRFISLSTKRLLDRIFLHVRRTGEPIKAFEFRFNGQEGQARALETSISLMRDGAGQPCGYRGIVRDVTERKEAEQRIKERDERFRGMIENTYDGIVMLSTEGKLLYVSPSYERIHGYSPAEVEGQTVTERIHPDDLPKVQQIAANLLPGKSETIRYRIRNKSGEYLWLEGTVTNLTEVPSVRGFVVNFRDITEQLRIEEERAQAESRMRASESRFRALIANSWEGISLHDAAGKILYVSPSYSRLLGYEPAEVLTVSQLNYIHPDDVTKLQAAQRELLEEPGRQLTVEHRAKHKDGSWRWLESRASNLLADPDIGAIVVNFHDITERKLAEEALRTSERRFRALVENGYDGIALQDAEGNITYVSPAYTRILGYELAEVIGHRAITRLHPDDAPQALQLREEVLQEPGAHRTMQLRMQHKDGSWRWMEVTITNLLNDPSVASVVINFRDITERHQAEEAMRESEQKFRAIWDNTLDAMLLVNDEMRYIDANPAACKLYGVTREELLARSMTDFVSPEKRDSARISLQKLITRGARKGHFQMTTPDYTIREIEYSAQANILPSLHLSVMRDVTERNRAEEALRTSEERYRSLVSVLAEGILMLDHEGELLTCNESAERILGLKRDELRERGLINLLQEAVREDGTPFPTDEAPSQVTLRTGQPCSGVILGVKRPTGELCWLSVSSQPVFQQDAELAHAVVVSLTDITERKKTEEALHESQERFSLAFNASPIAIAITDPVSGLCVSVNKTWAKLFGYEVGEVIGHSILELGIWQDPMARVEMIQHIDKHGKVRDFEAAMRTREDQTLNVVISAVRIELNNQTYLLTSTQDVTERKRAEMALRQSEAALRDSETRFSTAFALNPLAVTITDKQTGQLRNVNRAWCELFGFSAEEALGRTALELGMWPNPEARAEMYKHLSARGTLRDYETVHRTRDGEIKNIVISAEQITLGNQEYFLVLNQDITERKRAELAARESEERFSTAFNASPQPMIIVDFETRRFVNVNEAWLQTFGFSAEEVIGRTGVELNLWEDETERERIYTTVAAGGALKNMNAVLRCKLGEKRYCIISSDVIEAGDKRYMLSVTNDITDRRLAEEALRCSEARFASAFNTCPEPMALNRLSDGAYVSVNRAALRLIGLEEKDVLGRTPDELQLWADPAQRREFCEALQASGEVRDFECDLYLKGGHVGHFLISAEITELEGVPHVLSLATDITERKRAEAALRASEERFAKAFQSSPQPIAIISMPEGRFVTVNQAWTKTMDYTLEETAGRDTEELNLWPERGQRKRLLLALERARAIRDFELTLRTKQGELRHLIVFGEIIQLAGADYLLMTALDNTERKLAEAALRDSEKRYRLLFERNLAGVSRTTLDGVILDCNEAFATMFGFAAPEEIKAQTAHCLYADPAARAQLIEDLRAQGSLTNYELRLQRKDGSDIWVLANLTLLDGAIIEDVVLDITKRKYDEAKLAEARDQLRALSARLSAIREEERSAVAREIHDSLGQMLTGLKLDVAWLHKRLSVGQDEAQRELVEKTDNVAGLLDNTIQAVRELATRLRPGVLDTLGLTAAIEWQVQDFQTRTGIECEVWLCPEPKDLPKEQATGLFRILQELLTNIIRHAQATRVVIHLLPTDTGLLLSVTDNGRGITTGDLKDPKSLGLLGMRERAHMIGGEMKFEGAPERGTTVTVTVPLAR
jgi:PAS domain S-box-containing protein